VCVCVRACVHASLHTCAYMPNKMNTHLHPHGAHIARLCPFSGLLSGLCVKHTCIRTYTHTYIHTYIHKYIHTHIHTCMQTYIHTYIRTDIHTYVRTYIYAYIHTHIHTLDPPFVQACACTCIGVVKPHNLHDSLPSRNVY